MRRKRLDERDFLVQQARITRELLTEGSPGAPTPTVP
jgi:hypothetical protein